MSFWSKPRHTVRLLLERDEHQRGVHALMLLAGLSRLLAFEGAFASWMPTWTYWVVGIPASYWIMRVALNLMTRLFTWIGKAFEGRGTRQRVRLALAWASLPCSVCLMLDQLIAEPVLENVIFPTPEVGFAAYIVGVFLFMLVAGAWISWVTFVGVAEALRLWIWDAILTTSIASVLVYFFFYIPLVAISIAI